MFTTVMLSDRWKMIFELDLDTAKAFGFWMIIKPAVGGKGGIKADLSKFLRREYEVFIYNLPMKRTRG